jgi:hypothetical protein
MRENPKVFAMKESAFEEASASEIRCLTIYVRAVVTVFVKSARGRMSETDQSGRVF